jgi:hypothetical protein
MLNLNSCLQVALFVLLCQSAALAQAEIKSHSSRPPSAAGNAAKTEEKMGSLKSEFEEFELQRLELYKRSYFPKSSELDKVASHYLNNPSEMSTYFVARTYRNSTKSTGFVTKLNPESSQQYKAEWAWYRLANGELNEARKLIMELKSVGFFGSNQTIYGEWMAESAAKNAIVITSGEWDTYTLLATGRTDLTIVPMVLLNHEKFRAYLKKQLGLSTESVSSLNGLLKLMKNQSNVFVSLGVRSDEIKPVSKELKVTGVCAKWCNTNECKSETDLMNSAVFKASMEKLVSNKQSVAGWFKNVLPALHLLKGNPDHPLHSKAEAWINFINTYAHD